MKKIDGSYKLALKTGEEVPIEKFEQEGLLLKVVVGTPVSAKDFVIQDVGYVPLDNVKFISAAEVVIGDTEMDPDRIEQIKRDVAGHGPTAFLKKE